jgi:predicted small lipoprotein YifL
VNARLLAPWLALTTALAGCGLKGPLYLPEKSKEVVVRPAPTASAQPPSAPEAPAAEPAGETGSRPEPPAEREPPPPPGSSHG